jgi:hypothetical protein
VKEFTHIIFHSDDGMGEIKIDTINDTFGETNAKVSIVEDKEDASALSMKKVEASEVTHLSCIFDKCSSAQDVAKQLDILWNTFADLNITLKKKQIARAFFKRNVITKSDSEMHWYYCIMYFSKQPSFLKNC